MLLVDLIAGAMVTAGAATVIGIIGIVLTRTEERDEKEAMEHEFNTER